MTDDTMHEVRNGSYMDRLRIANHFLQDALRDIGLRNPSNGCILAYTRALGGRPELQPCSLDGTPLSVQDLLTLIAVQFMDLGLTVVYKMSEHSLNMKAEFDERDVLFPGIRAAPFDLPVNLYPHDTLE